MVTIAACSMNASANCFTPSASADDATSQSAPASEDAGQRRATTASQVCRAISLAAAPDQPDADRDDDEAVGKRFRSLPDRTRSMRPSASRRRGCKATRTATAHHRKIGGELPCVVPPAPSQRPACGAGSAATASRRLGTALASRRTLGYDRAGLAVHVASRETRGRRSGRRVRACVTIAYPRLRTSIGPIAFTSGSGNLPPQRDEAPDTWG